MFCQLWEKPGTDMNGNKIYGEFLFEECDGRNGGFQGDCEVNVAKWFGSDQLKNRCRSGLYDIWIYYPGKNDTQVACERITLDLN